MPQALKPLTGLTLRRKLLGLALSSAAIVALSAGIGMADTTTPAAAPVAVQANPFEEGYADLAASVLPAVVNVSVEKNLTPAMAEEQQGEDGGGMPQNMPEELKKFFGPGAPGMPKNHARRHVEGQGSGFVISADGYIVTNAHVAGDATKIEVAMQDGTKYPATLKGIDEKTDLALLKVEAGKPLPFLAFGDSSKVRVGDKVIAVGNPFGLGGTVTAGIVSATGRELGSGPYDDFLQVDAPINRGNSGGPTFNLDGQVIGINSMIFSPSGGSVGIGFAISSNLAKQIVADLQTDGKIERGWLGVAIQPLDDDLAANFGLPNTHGALVSKVQPDSPALAAGIKDGDVILSFDGKPIDRLIQLTKAVASVEPGKKAEVGIWRDGKAETLSMAVGTMPTDDQVASAQPDADEANQPRLGLALAPLTPELRKEMGVDANLKGVVVRDVADGSPAEAKGIRAGDVIVAIKKKPVDSPAAVQAAVKTAFSEGQKSILMQIQREGGQIYLAVPLAVS